ncbi:MAG: ABC transporter ATP-binding protein [Chloroflexota bacterium]|nr:MAG: ABC transporter ATP-binding protein [Chloroflexota bacterium]
MNDSTPNSAFRTPNCAIEVRDLRKVFSGKAVVDGLSLTVEQGEIFGFLGPNGAGKTTSIKMLTGLVHPTSGSSWLLGRPLGDLSVRKRIGFLPEQFRFHEWMRADEFLDFHGQLYGMSAAERRQRIPEALELVKLTDRAGDRLRTFSKGMLQRIGLAQALLNAPALVFLDEPTSGLDPIGRRDVRDLIRGLKQRGVTVFLNSHLLGEVEMVCDRVAILDAGRVVWSGPMASLAGEGVEVEVRMSEVTDELLSELGRMGPLSHSMDSTYRIMLPDETQTPVLAETIVRHGARLYSLAPRHSTLEELFVKLVKSGGDR